MNQYVLISGQYKRLGNRLKEIQKELQLKNLQIKPPHVYFEVDMNLSKLETIRQVKIKMYEDKSTWELFFQIYPVENGKIDYLPYMSENIKKAKYNYYKGE